jgi:hypothetical protein
MRHQVKVAGDASSLTITTMHDIGNTFDPLFVTPELYGISGLSFAVVDDQVWMFWLFADNFFVVV